MDWNLLRHLLLKQELASDSVLVPYDPKLPLLLTCDASPLGIGAILSHKISDAEKPIAYASRSLTSSEKNYSQSDKEALALIFGVNHFFHYLYGRNFELITDNEPVSRIFQHNKNLPAMTSSRLLRYASFLSGFNYTLKCKKGVNNGNVDCLSRAPVTQNYVSIDMSFNREVHQIQMDAIFEISSQNITFEKIVSETANG